MKQLPTFLFRYILCLTALCSGCTTETETQKKAESPSVFQPEALIRAKELPQKGILKENDEGSVYLSVSEDYITEIVPLIKTTGKVEFPQHPKKRILAHISVITSNERKNHIAHRIEELGDTYNFTVKEIKSIDEPAKNERVWLITIEAPALNELREKYGLPPYLNHHPFHITIGYESLKR